jgi:uncharacterized protein YciI
MFIVNLTYIKPLEIIDQIRPEHVEFLDKYYAKNIFLISGPQNPRIGGIIIAHKVNKEELQLILEEDPFFIQGAAKFEIVEFTANKYNQYFQNFLVTNK